MLLSEHGLSIHNMGFLPQSFYRYERLARNEDGLVEDVQPRGRRKSWSTAIVLVALFLAALAWITLRGPASKTPARCDSDNDGFQCSPDISHFWGQYSAYYRVPSSIPNDVPKHCKVTFANVLSRHGARDPALSKTIIYGAFVAALQTNVTSFTGKYAFLRDYKYSLGADMLTAFGEQQMVNNGIKFYGRYKHLAKTATPFMRTAGQQRVVDSANLFGTGFHQAYVEDNEDKKDSYPYPLVIIEESSTSNNTLSYSRCPAFRDDKPDIEAQGEWMDVFIPPIIERLEKDLPGLQLAKQDVISFMDLCPFETMASPTGALSPFCYIFSKKEWRQYDYYESLGKWYGYGNGNSLGATNGVGFVNELIARLTNSPVKDHTSTNRTLDSDPKTFPLGPEYPLFADFSHDNDLTTIIAALGLYNTTAPLSNTTLQNVHETKGYSASWTVPFAGRLYFEKLQCGHDEEEKVRVLVNDRVIPLPWCGGKKDGMCKLSRFVDGLSFARQGGRWNECFE